MSALHHPPAHLPPAVALQLSQQAPNILENAPGSVANSALQSLFSATETADLWNIYENLLLSCLRTGDETSAHQCLERLVSRFGDDNERIMALKGLLKEADAGDNATLEIVLKDYERILEASPTNVPIIKRRIALLRSLNRLSDAVAALNSLLDFSPTDAESWSELADIYLSQGLYQQSIYALEEVLVLQPNAWNMHAKLGETLLIASRTSSQAESTQKWLAEALKRFCRSVELCDNYLRGYYGLKLVVNQLLQDTSKGSKPSDATAFTLPDTATIQGLNVLATEKLSEIVRRNATGERSWQGYNAAEITLARDLLDAESTTTVR